MGPQYRWVWIIWWRRVLERRQCEQSEWDEPASTVGWWRHLLCSTERRFMDTAQHSAPFPHSQCVLLGPWASPESLLGSIISKTPLAGLIPFPFFFPNSQWASVTCQAGPCYTGTQRQKTVSSLKELVEEEEKSDYNAVAKSSQMSFLPLFLPVI